LNNKVAKAGGNLNEYKIKESKAAGSKITIFIDMAMIFRSKGIY